MRGITYEIIISSPGAMQIGITEKFNSFQDAYRAARRQRKIANEGCILDVWEIYSVSRVNVFADNGAKYRIDLRVKGFDSPLQFLLHEHNNAKIVAMISALAYEGVGAVVNIIKQGNVTVTVVSKLI